MENVEKSEVCPEKVNSEVTTKEQSSPEIKVKKLSNLTHDFLMNESNNKHGSIVFQQNAKHDPESESKLSFTSSSNLINTETSINSTSDQPLQSEDQSVTKTSDNLDIDPKNPIYMGGDEVMVDKDFQDTSHDKVRFGEKSHEIDSKPINFTSESVIETEGSCGNKSVEGDHDLPTQNHVNPVQNLTTETSTNISGTSIEESSAETKKEPEEEWMDILGSGHLMKKVIKSGVPNSRPLKSDICVLNLIGRLEDGTIVEQHENLEINLSDNEVVQGLDFALALMDKGEEAEVKVAPRFGYGSLGKRPEIPSGANLIYNVTLLDVKEEPQIHTLEVNERIKVGLKKKERGNWWYSRDENTLAINCYRRALDYLDDTDIPEPHDDGDVRRLLEERLKTYNNLGASQMKISAFDAALMSVNNVLAAQPNNVKALFRKSKILKEKGELQESINVVKQALSHEPESQTLQQELSTLMAAQRKVNSKQRELYKKMMGNTNNQTDEDKKKNSKNNYKTFTLVAAVSFAVAVLGTIVVKYKF